MSALFITFFEEGDELEAAFDDHYDQLFERHPDAEVDSTKLTSANGKLMISTLYTEEDQ